MRCRRCDHENTSDANFCSLCGAPLGTDDGDHTLALATLEERQELETELGVELDRIPDGMALLVVRRGANAGSTFVLESEATTIGRHPESGILLDDVTVSRRHAVVTRVDDGFELADTGSLNGTYVDRERIERSLLRDLAEIQIGRFVLTFVVGGGDGAS